uniref:ATP synthase complex subunit 8 n=1 Tax=Neopanorpa pulchra TaxID=557178 RepID=C7SFN2_9NEOP|nr:ATP synthase F0 subunit 8 [Neopanorpa pulchra]ACH87048.1 ATP synthase F0 subunit 8 [Neopanorpa pulchra]AFU51391.1 ATP synthase F0 subunit 8 [Neopanorpa pulchra]
MPQMAPINWLSLFIMFSIILLLFNMMNYYSFTPKLPNSKETSNISFKSLNWKW